MSLTQIEMTELGEVAEFVRGINFKPDDVVAESSPDVVACMRTKNVQTELDQTDVWFVGRQFVKRDEQMLVHGDILISSANSWNLVGKCCWIPELPWKASFGGFVTVLRANRKRTFPRYLYHWFSSPHVQDLARSFGRQTTNISNLDLNRCLKMRIPLPPLSEQKRIAAILDQAEELRSKRRVAMALLDELTQSIFLDMFGDPVTNPKGWPIRPFQELGDNEDSKRVPIKSSDRDGIEGEYPYYGASGIIDWIDDYIFDGERLLIGEDGANLVARVTPVAYMAYGRYWVNNHAHVIAENGKANLRYLEFMIEQIDLKPYISGTAQPKLNRSNLDRIEVPTPPITAQREFALRIVHVESMREQQMCALARLDALFAALQHRAFRGEL